MGEFDGRVNIPLRRNHSVDIVNLPADLTFEEAARISKIVLALAQPAGRDEHLDTSTLTRMGQQAPLPVWAPWQICVIEHVLWTPQYWRPVRFDQLNDEFCRIANLTLVFVQKIEAGSSFGEYPLELSQDLKIFGQFAQVIEACLVVRKSLVVSSLLRISGPGSTITMGIALQISGINHESMAAEVEKMVDAGLLTTKKEGQRIFHTRSF